ncbi:hypothetical protein GGF50DRAFT_112396 [Schizophyllum commune]
MSERHDSGLSESNVAPEPSPGDGNDDYPSEFDSVLTVVPDAHAGELDGSHPPDSDSEFTIVHEDGSGGVDDSHSSVSEPKPTATPESGSGGEESKKEEPTAADIMADIPSPPSESDSSDYPWNYGWAVHPERVLELLSIYRPLDLHITDDEKPTDPLAPPRVEIQLGNAYFRQLRGLDASVKAFANYFPLRYCFVKPVMDDEPRTTELTIPELQVRCADGKFPVSFFMVNSTVDEYFRKTRPHKQHMEKLNQFFGEEPCWREDAVERSRWHAYYKHPF